MNEATLKFEAGIRPDFCLFTDGSGYQDGLGGWCCVLTDPQRTKFVYRIGASTGSSVDSMEFTALLEGLDLVLEQELVWNGRPIRRLNAKPTVLWRSDRESLVLSVKGDYRRENLPALWQQFAYYEKRLHIVPVHVNREMEAELPEFRFCDLHASTMREVLKGYMPTVEIPNEPIDSKVGT